MDHNQKPALCPRPRSKPALAITLLSALLLGIVCAGLGVPRPVTAQERRSNPSDQIVPPPPAGHIYHGVFPGEELADSRPPEDGIPFEEDGIGLALV